MTHLKSRLHWVPVLRGLMALRAWPWRTQLALPGEPAPRRAGLNAPARGLSALVVGFEAGERHRVAMHLEHAGLAVAAAADGFSALAMAARMAELHGALDLMVLDAALGGMPAETLLSRLKGARLKVGVDFDRLRIVLVGSGQVAGAFGGGAEGCAAELDAAVAGIFAHEARSVVGAGGWVKESAFAA